MTSPPRVAGKCDKCGGALYQRDDDKPKTVRSRLHQQRPPADMLTHYRLNRRLAEIDGSQPVEVVTRAVMGVVEEMKKQPVRGAK